MKALFTTIALILFTASAVSAKSISRYEAETVKRFKKDELVFCICVSVRHPPVLITLRKLPNGRFVP